MTRKVDTLIIALLLALLVGGSRAACEEMGPPAPTTQSGSTSWGWYAGAWALNTTSTLIAVNRGGVESNPIFKGHHDRAIIAKGAAALACWQLEERTGSKVGRWVFVGLSILTAGYEFTVAF